MCSVIVNMIRAPMIRSSKKSEKNPSSHSKIGLYNKLRSLQVEIDVVASTVNKDKAMATNVDDILDD